MADIVSKKMIINGKWVSAVNSKTYPLYNPANGNLIANISDGGSEETKAAIEAAKNALPAWSNLPAKERGRLLRIAETIMLSRVDAIAHGITLENGKSFPEAQQEVVFSSGYLNWYAEEARRAYGEWIPSPFAHKRLMTMIKPVGVVCAVTPWNFPANMITRKIAPAIAAGCTLVLKPADTTPLTALALGEVFIEAGIPAGVFNIITAKDPKPIGDIFTSHPAVNMVTFTGSARVGELLAQQSAKTVKRIGLELGGNAPVIIFDDADFEKAVDRALAIKFLRVGGESCICANRIFVQQGIYEKFLTAFTNKVTQLKVGDGFSPGVRVGPLITKQACERVAELVEATKKLSPRLLLGGHKLTEPPYDKGNFFAPTVFADCQDNWDIAKQEIFGPVACIYPFQTEQEVYARANNTEYGLAAYVFSQNINKIIRACEALEFGFIGVNDGDGYTHEIPVGGLKTSGIGREGGQKGLHEYLEVQSILFNLD